MQADNANRPQELRGPVLCAAFGGGLHRPHITSTRHVPESTDPVRTAELDSDAHAHELERRAAAAVDPCERERLLYLSHFARNGLVLPAVDPLGEPSGDRMDENGRQP